MQNGLNMDTTYDFKACLGLTVKPRQGDGLLFYSVFPNGTIDQVKVLIFSFYLPFHNMMSWKVCNILVSLLSNVCS